VTQGHVDDEVLNACQLEILDHEVCLLESTAVYTVGHVLAVGFVSRLGELLYLKERKQ
jgi:hypothetical protein